MEESPVRAQSNMPYVVAVLVMSLLGVGAIIGITLMRPDKDNTTVIASLVGFLAPTTMALLAFMKSQETHKAVNGRMDKFIKAAVAFAYTQGADEERKRAALEALERLSDEFNKS